MTELTVTAAGTAPPAPAPGAPAPLPLVDRFERGLSAPICLTWELTYACNLSCRHCLSSSGRRDPRELPAAQCRAVVDELARMQVFYVNIGGGAIRNLADAGFAGFKISVVITRHNAGFTRVWRSSGLFTELRRPQAGGACRSCGAFDACRGGCMAAKFFTGLPLDGPDPEYVLGHGEPALAAADPAAVPRPAADHSHRGRVPVSIGRRPPDRACDEHPLAGAALPTAGT